MTGEVQLPQKKEVAERPTVTLDNREEREMTCDVPDLSEPKAGEDRARPPPKAGGVAGSLPKAGIDGENMEYRESNV